MDWYSSKHVDRILKIKFNHKNFVHLVDFYTYGGMMYGAYNVKLITGLILFLIIVNMLLLLLYLHRDFM